MTPYFATCARGLEPILAGELADLGADGVEPGRGGVTLPRRHGRCSTGPTSGCAPPSACCGRSSKPTSARRTNCTTPSGPSTGRVPDARPHAGRRLQRPRLGDHALAVRRPAGQGRDLRPVPRRVGRRPSVDVEQPMVGLNLHVYREPRDAEPRQLVGLAAQARLPADPDRSRRSTRRWRRACCFNAAGTRRRRSSIRCAARGRSASRRRGSRSNRPPGLTRKRFGFMGWLDFDRPLWNAIRDDARRGGSQGAARADRRQRRATATRSSSRGRTPAPPASATWSSFERRDLRAARPPEGAPGVVICNPPYGERIGEEKELVGLYREHRRRDRRALARVAAVRVHQQRPARPEGRAAGRAAARRSSTASSNATCGSLGRR